MESQEPLGWPEWIGIVVNDLEQQRRLWGDLLGVPEVAAESDYVQFDMGGGNVFELIKRSELPQYDQKRFQVGFAKDFEAGAAPSRSRKWERLGPHQTHLESARENRQSPVDFFE